MHIAAMIWFWVLAFLYSLVGLLYVVDGTIFSKLWHWLCFAATGNSTVELPAQDEQFFAIIHPVFVATLKGAASWIIFLIGLSLFATAGFLIFGNIIGIISALSFAVLEIFLSVYFYWGKDRADAIKHLAVHAITGGLTVAAWVML